MEFNEKLQSLRKGKNLTQEELAAQLYVSRTAVSKWESGRGYPSIDSLKAISKFFSVPVDALLSGETLPEAGEKSRPAENNAPDTAFALLDCCAALFFLLPLFGQSADGAIRSVSLVSLTSAAPYLKAAYLVFVLASVLTGILCFALKNCAHPLWLRSKRPLSLCIGALGLLLMTAGRQPYAAAFAFALLSIKALILLKTAPTRSVSPM